MGAKFQNQSYSRHVSFGFVFELEVKAMSEQGLSDSQPISEDSTKSVGVLEYWPLS